MNLLKKGMYILLGLSLTIACKSDDETVGGGDTTTITNLDFSIVSKNDTGNQVGVTPTSTGGTSYSIDFNNPAVTDNSDIVSTAGAEATYTYPESTATYDITVTASATNAENVSVTKSHTVTFEAATVLADFEDASKINPKDDAGGAVSIIIEPQTALNGSTSNVGVATYTGAGNWDAFSLNPTNYINPIEKGVITVEYYQSEGVAREILLKLEGTKTVEDGIFDIEVLTTSTADTGWQTLTFDFKSNAVGSYPNGELPVVLDHYSTMSIFVDFGTPVAGTYWFDNIEGAEWGDAIADTDGDGIIDSIDSCPDVAADTEDGCPVVTAPTTAAPTPTHADVISIYSDAYTDVEGTNLNPAWSQSTTFSLETIAGNETIKYGNLNYQGIEFAAAIDASSKTILHIDVYTGDLNALDIFPISSTTGDTILVTKTLTPNSWNSLEIPLSEFVGLSSSDLIQFKLAGNPWAQDGFGTIYVDNIYFHN